LKEETAMKQNRNLLAAGAVILVCLVVAALATSIPGKEKNYEVEAITSPEYKTDAARAIDAYERLMDRYMDLSEKLLSQMGGDCQTVSAKLDSLDSRVAELSARLARIEKALGIKPDVNGTPQAKINK
jgi:cell division septation protein DedD